MPVERDLIADNIELLLQIEDLIEPLDDRSFVESPVGLLHSGIGSHIRHCLDFYDCFLRGIGEGLIDYDHRDRDLACERDRKAALERMALTAAMLRELAGIDLERSCRVILEGCNRREEAPSRSTLRRELQFLVSHTVHHCALVAVILNWQGRKVPRDFGVAPSSITHWAEQKKEYGTNGINGKNESLASKETLD